MNTIINNTWIIIKFGMITCLAIANKIPLETPVTCLEKLIL